MCWLNELGASAVSARTEDIDLAARHQLKFGVPESFLALVKATRLGFVPVPTKPPCSLAGTVFASCFQVLKDSSGTSCTPARRAVASPKKHKKT